VHELIDSGNCFLPENTANAETHVGQNDFCEGISADL
jgi:hypothetical protein